METVPPLVFTSHGVREDYCYQRIIHILDQNSGRKRSCGGSGGPPGDGGGGGPPGGAGVAGQRSPNHPVS